MLVSRQGNRPIFLFRSVEKSATTSRSSPEVTSKQSYQIADVKDEFDTVKLALTSTRGGRSRPNSANASAAVNAILEESRPVSGAERLLGAIKKLVTATKSLKEAEEQTLLTEKQQKAFRGERANLNNALERVAASEEFTDLQNAVSTALDSIASGSGERGHEELSGQAPLLGDSFLQLVKERRSDQVAAIGSLLTDISNFSFSSASIASLEKLERRISDSLSVLAGPKDKRKANAEETSTTRAAGVAGQIETVVDTDRLLIAALGQLNRLSEDQSNIHHSLDTRRVNDLLDPAGIEGRPGPV